MKINLRKTIRFWEKPLVIIFIASSIFKSIVVQASSLDLIDYFEQNQSSQALNLLKEKYPCPTEDGFSFSILKQIKPLLNGAITKLVVPIDGKRLSMILENPDEKLTQVELALSPTSDCLLNSANLKSSNLNFSKEHNHSLTSNDIKMVVDSVKEKVRFRYINQDVAKGYVAWIDSLKLKHTLTVNELALTLEQGFKAIYNDKHFQVFTPYQERSAFERFYGDDNHKGQCNSPIQIESIDQNTLLLKITSFPDQACVEQHLPQVIEEVKDTDRLIIDVRLNNGGDSALVSAITSLFTESYKVTGYVETMNPQGVLDRKENKVTPAPQAHFFKNTEVYVLTSKKTFSAGEALAQSLKGRATLVGQTTRGGGHITDWTKLTKGFSLALPVGRVLDKNKNPIVEGTGVAPDWVTQGDALDYLLSRLSTST